MWIGGQGPLGTPGNGNNSFGVGSFAWVSAFFLLLLPFGPPFLLSLPSGFLEDGFYLKVVSFWSTVSLSLESVAPGVSS